MIADLSKMEEVPYQILVSLLMYATLGTCSDISYAIQALLQFSIHPGPMHWTATKDVLLYLKGMQN